jgi:hypothetical protein
MTRVGTCHWLEQGLEASRRALTAPLVDHADDPGSSLPDDGNLGFYRPGAKLVVIYVSDEDDQSESDVSSYLAFFKALKPDPSMLSVSAVVTPLDMSTCLAGTSSGSRYVQLVDALGAGVVESICTLDWAASLAAGRPRLRAQRRLPAHGPPADPAKIEVKVNGVAVGGWSYDPDKTCPLLPAEPPPAGSQSRSATGGLRLTRARPRPPAGAGRAALYTPVPCEPRPQRCSPRPTSRRCSSCTACACTGAARRAQPELLKRFDYRVVWTSCSRLPARRGPPPPAPTPHGAGLLREQPGSCPSRPA